MSVMRTYKPFLALAALATGLAGFSALHASMSALAAAPTAAPMQVSDINGAAQSIPAPSAKATVLLFVSTQCPYSNQASPEMARITKAYSQKGFDFIYVYGDSYETKAGISKHAAQYGFSSAPVVMDSGDKIVQAAGATNTPEAVVLSPSGKMLYRGRIDNRFSSVGVTRTVVSSTTSPTRSTPLPPAKPPRMLLCSPWDAAFTKRAAVCLIPPGIRRDKALTP